MNPSPKPFWQRIASAALALLFFGIAVQMLIDPAGWYSSTPGVPDTGPMNTHFIRDIGAGFLMSAFAYAFCASKQSVWPLPVVGAVFPGIHAAIHAASLLSGHSHGSPAVDFFGVVVPGTLAVTLAVISIKTSVKQGISL